MDFKKIINSLAIIILTIASGLAISYCHFSVLVALVIFIFFLFILIYPDKALFFLVAYLPFQIALNPAPGIDLASGRVLILLIFAAWILKSFGEKRFFIPNVPQTWLILIFLFLSSLSILVAEDLERAFRKILVFLSIFPLYFLIISIIDNKEKLKKIIRLIFISAAAISFIGLVQFFVQFVVGFEKISNFWAEIIAPLFYGRAFTAQIITTPSWYVNIEGITYLRAFSFFPDPHMFSFYIGLVLPIAIALLFYKSKKAIFWNLAFGIFICLLFIVNCLSFSRGGYLGMMFGILAVCLLLRKKIITKKLFITLLIIFMAFGFFLAENPVAARFLSIFDFGEGSNIGRIETWKEAMKVVQDNPILGVGIGNYSYEIEPTASYRAPIYAHNTYLDIAGEMGLFTLAVWLLLIGITIWQLIIIARDIESSGPEEIKLIAAGLTGSLIWFSVHSFFESPIYSPTILAMLMIVLGLSVSIRRIANCDLISKT